MDNATGAPETKADVKAAFEDFMRGYESFREANDKRLDDIEKKAADVLTDEKLARIEASLDANNRRMDQLVLERARPSLSGEMPALANETKSAFAGYMRSGDEAALRTLEKKTAMAAGTGSVDAGLTVPAEVETEVLRRMAAISPIRAISTVRTVSGSVYRKPVASTGVPANWAAETGARTEGSPTLSEIQIPTMELYAMPAATQMLLDDTAIDMDEWLAAEIETVFAEQETKAFVIGNGTSQPKGFTKYTTVAEASWEWDKIGIVKTGVNGAFPSTTPSDKLVDLVYTLKAGYRQNAHFVMNRSTQAAVRKMKDADGLYLWTPPAAPGGRASVLNFPVVEAEDMPAIATNSLSIAFGDFRRGYLVVDRMGIRILRDPYSSKPHVLFYTTKRVGGGVQDFDAIKLLQFAA